MSFDFEYWAMLEPMKYFDRPDDSKLSSNLLKKKYDMIENTNNDCIASQKWDGEWTMFIRGIGDEVLIRSRSISTVTGRYGDKTLHLPHLVNEMMKWPEGSVVLAEVCYPTLGKMSTDVGTILRCLPNRAVQRQKEDVWLSARVFDILCWNGVSMINNHYIDRVHFLLEHFTNNSNNYFNPTEFYDSDFQIWADDIISRGGEGVVIQRKNALYEPGKRTSWNTLKLKQSMQEMELPVVGTKEPTKEYQGKDIDGWPYWLDGVAVSKAYYYGWKMGVTVDFNGTLVDIASGLSDADREWLASEEAKQDIAAGKLYASVKAMQVASLGGLRHPKVLRLRQMDEAMLEHIEVE